MIICNRKQGHYSDRRICEMMTLNEIRYIIRAYSSMAPDPAFAFVEGPCCPILDFVCVFWTVITFTTLLLRHFIFYTLISISEDELDISTGVHP